MEGLCPSAPPVPSTLISSLRCSSVTNNDALLGKKLYLTKLSV